MRRFVLLLFTLGIAVLPPTVLAQYPPAHYYPRPMPVYGPSYPYGWQAAPASYPRSYGPAPLSPPVYYPVSTNYAPPRPLPPAPPPVYYSYTAKSSAVAPPPRTHPEAPPPAIPPLPLISPQSPVTEEAPVEERELEPITPPREQDDNELEIIKIQPPADLSNLPVTDGPQGNQTLTVDHPPLVAGDCLDGFCPWNGKNWSVFVFGDILYWTVRGADVPYAQSFDGVSPLAVPRGPVATADPDYSTGFRVGGGVRLGERQWIQAAFTLFESSTTDQITALPDTVIRSYVVFPTTLTAAFTSLEADARYDIDLYMGDVDYKCAIWQTPHLLVNYLVGVRYAHLDEVFISNFDILGETTVSSTINFDGVGPRAGIEGEFHTSHGFFGYSKGVMNLLAGHYSARYDQRNIFTGLQAETNVGDDRLVPVLELEVGAGWVGPKGHLRLYGGYYIGAWFNTMTTNSLVRAIQASDFTTNGDNFRDTITFDGFVGRLELRY